MTTQAKKKLTDQGYKEGESKRFISGHNFLNVRPHNYSGGTAKDGGGYVQLLIRSHPHAKKSGYVLEHIVIASKALGKKLPIKSQIHHVNGVKDDNRNINLFICQDLAYHKLLHRRQNALKFTGNPNARRCKFCKTWDSPENIVIAGRYTYHQKCNRETKRIQAQNRKSNKLRR